MRIDARSLIRAAEAAASRGEYDKALRVLHRLYGSDASSVPADGLSLYGYCLARIENRTKLGIECCTLAIQKQPYESRHRVNLVQIYLAAGSRRKAVDVLEQAMRQLADDPAILAIRDSMGYRRRSTFPFLRRDHPLNVMIGKLRRRR